MGYCRYLLDKWQIKHGSGETLAAINAFRVFSLACSYIFVLLFSYNAIPDNCTTKSTQLVTRNQKETIRRLYERKKNKKSITASIQCNAMNNELGANAGNQTF
jgi:hypothetical protein